MIFVSVGTHPHPFTRLLSEIARLVDEKIITEKVIVQAGYTSFKHSKILVYDFLSLDEFEKNVEKCSLFITHAGEGNIGLGFQKKKPMIIVPRRQKWGEHTDDHQLELARASQKRGYGRVISDVKLLRESILTPPIVREANDKSFFNSILHRVARESGLKVPLFNNHSWKKPQTASIVVATLNGGMPLIKAINGMLRQDFPGKYEIIVVDDGSFDNVTPELLRKHFTGHEKVKLIFLPRSGVCKARNAGIRAAQYDTIINMDHDDNPEPDWLRIMMSGFDSPTVGAVSAYGHYGGTSTGFRRDILEHLSGYDEDYFYYREDTDLSFRIMELGFDYRKVNGAKWHGDRTLVTPKTVPKMIAYTIQRLTYHMNDVLLHKKHHTLLCNQFLNVKWKWFVDPVVDFRVATGLWKGKETDIALSSPRGMIFLSNKSPLHFLLIIILGFGYVIAIKMARLAGSIKHGHFLV